MGKNVRNSPPNADCTDCGLARGYIKPKVGGPIIRLQGNWSLFHNGDDRTFLGWLLLVPQKHYKSWSSLGVDESKWLVKHIKQVDKLLRSYWDQRFHEDPIQRVYVVAFAESTSHVHFHLIPRTQKMELEIPGWDIYKIPWRTYRKKYHLQKYIIRKRPQNKNANDLMNHLRKKLLKKDSSQ